MKLSLLLISSLLLSSTSLAANSSTHRYELIKKKKKKKKKKDKKKKQKGSSQGDSKLASWFGPNWKESVNLSHLGNFNKNLSGAHWDHNGERLFAIVNSPATIYELNLENGDFVKGKKISAKGDFEGITMRPSVKNKVYIMEEGRESIVEFDLNSSKKTAEWNLSGLPTQSRNGPEGIAFIGDKFLGNGIAKSKAGMGGLFVVAHQNGGELFFFDLDPSTNRADLALSVKTGASESSGLEFDESENKLYIWHNTGGNSIEVVRPSLGANGRLELIKHIRGPKSGNIEGIAVGSTGNGEHYLFFTDDDNQDDYALFWYPDFSI